MLANSFSYPEPLCVKEATAMPAERTWQESFIQHGFQPLDWLESLNQHRVQQLMLCHLEERYAKKEGMDLMGYDSLAPNVDWHGEAINADWCQPMGGYNPKLLG